MSDEVYRYIMGFRVRELQECLQSLGLTKTGKKNELVARLRQHLSTTKSDTHKFALAEREVIRIYRKMQGLPNGGVGPSHQGVPPAFQPRGQAAGNAPTNHLPNGLQIPGLGGNSRLPGQPYLQNGSFGGDTKEALATSTSARNILQTGAGLGRLQPGQPPPRRTDSADDNSVIRCICGHHLDVGDMIQCEGENCGVWQHSRCVGIDPNAVPENYFCEMCRVARADPFWARTYANFFPAARLAPQLPEIHLSPAGSEQLVSIRAEREFTLTAAQWHTARSPDHQLQLACLLLGDTVPFRLHWPMSVGLVINGRPYRPYNRSYSNKLGKLAVDDPANIATLASAGRNTISLTGVDSRPFCIVLQIAKRRSTADVIAMMAPPETVEEALARVRRKTSGTRTAGSDDDDELQVQAEVVPLKDPNTSLRVVDPVRFRGSTGIVAFDLETYLSLAQRTRKWLCPYSNQACSIRELQRDAFLGPILTALKGHPKVMEIQLTPDGRWRPDGSDCRFISITEEPAAVAAALANEKIKPDPEAPQPAAGLDDVSTSEDISEGEEMRRAALACTSSARKAAPPQPDIIVLSDSDDEVAPPVRLRPVPVRPKGTLARAVGSPVSGGGSLRGAGTSGQTSGDSSRYHPYQRQANGNAPPRSSQVPIWPAARHPGPPSGMRLGERPIPQASMPGTGPLPPLPVFDSVPIHRPLPYGAPSGGLPHVPYQPTANHGSPPYGAPYPGTLMPSHLHMPRPLPSAPTATSGYFAVPQLAGESGSGFAPMAVPAQPSNCNFGLQDTSQPGGGGPAGYVPQAAMPPPPNGFPYMPAPPPDFNIPQLASGGRMPGTVESYPGTSQGHPGGQALGTSGSGFMPMQPLPFSNPQGSHYMCAPQPSGADQGQPGGAHVQQMNPQMGSYPGTVLAGGGPAQQSTPNFVEMTDESMFSERGIAGGQAMGPNGTGGDLTWNRGIQNGSAGQIASAVDAPPQAAGEHAPPAPGSGIPILPVQAAPVYLPLPAATGPRDFLEDPFLDDLLGGDHAPQAATGGIGSAGFPASHEQSAATNPMQAWPNGSNVAGIDVIELFDSD